MVQGIAGGGNGSGICREGSRQLNTISGINLFIVILSCERKSARGLQPAGNVLGRQLVAGIPGVAHRPPHAIPWRRRRDSAAWRHPGLSAAAPAGRAGWDGFAERLLRYAPTVSANCR